MRFFLRKTERLHRKKLIEELFNKGSYFYLHPFKVYYVERGDENQLLISVPKKKIRQAVDRNKVKRRIRESYRLSKHTISRDGLLLGFVFIGSKPVKYSDINAAMVNIIDKLNKVE